MSRKMGKDFILYPVKGRMRRRLLGQNGVVCLYFLTKPKNHSMSVLLCGFLFTYMQSSLSWPTWPE